MSRPGPRPRPNVAGLLEDAAHTIGEASDTPALDARLLLQALMKKDHAWLLAHGDAEVDAETARRLRAWARRRAKSEPVAYIIERKPFRDHELKVTTDVLVPRPETELLVERALAHIALSEPLWIADLGTGSGAVGLAIAAERPLCTVIATDASRAALDIAEQNKARTGLRNIHFKHGDWYRALGAQRFTVIACNPPYVPHSYYEATLSHEPEQALFSGPQGLDALQTVIAGAPAHLEAGGWLLVEHGFDQRDAVQSLFHQTGFEAIDTIHDHAGHPRVTEGLRPRDD